MKMKGILALGGCLLILAGCQGAREKPESNLTLLNCSQLKEFHQSAKNELNKSVENRETENAVNIAVGVLGMLSGSGSFSTRGASKEERDLEIELAAIESVAKEKGCETITVAQQ